MRKIALAVVGFLAAAAVVGFVASGGLPSISHRAAEGSAGGSAARVVVPAAPEIATGPAASDETVAVGTLGAGGVSTTVAVDVIGPHIVKTAEIRLKVRSGGFDEAFDSASLVAGTYGGYVESSSMSGVESRSGDLVIRVPSTSFDDAMRDLRELGTVEHQSISGRDVTAEYVDLTARLRTWETQEAVLLRLMREATTVEDTLRVQRDLQDVQFRIEQIKGQLRVIENQTDLATVHVSIHEPGAIVVRQTPAGDRPSLAEAWARAVNGFLAVISATVIGLGYLVPIALLVGLGWYGYRRLRPQAVDLAG